MKNLIADGDTINVTAPDDTDHVGGSSGDGVQVGSLFGVAVNDFVAGGDVTLVLEGVFDLAKKTAEAWSQGAKVYWDDSNLYCTTTAGSNLLIGKAFQDEDASAAVGQVRLSPA